VNEEALAQWGGCRAKNNTNKNPVYIVQAVSNLLFPMHIASIITGSLVGTNMKKQVQFRILRTVCRFFLITAVQETSAFSKSGTHRLESAFKHSLGLFKGKMLPFALWFSDSSATSEVKTIKEPKRKRTE